MDDKSDVISILWVSSSPYSYLCSDRNLCRITIDTLLKHGFTPARTFVFAFGFDEEASSLAVRAASIYLQT